jgi:hypothetical protein
MCPFAQRTTQTTPVKALMGPIPQLRIIDPTDFHLVESIEK